MYNFMKLEEYSDKAIVIRGEYTKKYIDQLKSMNGKFNPKLKGGPGWIFSKRHKYKLNIFIDQKNKECFDESQSEEKFYLQTVFETERNNVKRNRDIFEFDTEECDIEFDTMENKRMNEFGKFNKSILKMKRILKLSFIFFNLYLMIYF